MVDAIGSGRKQLYDGREWDYVFDVDIAEGVPPLKLPYNVSGMSAAMPFLTFFREPLHCRTALP